MASKEPTSLPMRIAVDLIEMARIICSHRSKGRTKSLKQTEYIDSILRPKITRDYQTLLDSLKGEEKDGGPKP
jgi:hypothetical protein